MSPDDARELARSLLQTSLTPVVYELADDLEAAQDLLGEVVADYDRRRATWRGRLLLWLLRTA